MNSILKYVMLSICITYLGAIKFRCDYKYHDIGWFKYHEIPMSWPDARLYCHLQGAMLSSPTTPTIMGIMKNATRNIGIFTGIHTTVSKGQYYSVNGIPLSEISHKWMEKEPENEHNIENCLILTSEGEMADVKCDEPRPFMCFRPKIRKGVNICGTVDSEYRFYRCTNKCYKFHTKPRQFHRAHFACTAEGGHLAIINSEIELKVIKDIFSKYPSKMLLGNFFKDYAFIGFYNWGESSDWTTIHGQSIEEAGYDKFPDGQPNNATNGEYCGGVFRNGLLNDIECESPVAFICEKRPDFPTICDSDDQRF